MRVQKSQGARVAQRLHCQESRSEAEVEHGSVEQSMAVAFWKPLKRGFPCRTGKARPNQSVTSPGSCWTTCRHGQGCRWVSCAALARRIIIPQCQLFILAQGLLCAVPCASPLCSCCALQRDSDLLRSPSPARSRSCKRELSLPAIVTASRLCRTSTPPSTRNPLTTAALHSNTAPLLDERRCRGRTAWILHPHLRQRAANGQ